MVLSFNWFVCYVVVVEASKALLMDLPYLSFAAELLNFLEISGYIIFPLCISGEILRLGRINF